MAAYDPPEIIKTEIVATMPERYSRKGSSPGRIATRYARPQVGVDFYLEGPAFDRAGNLYFVDVPHGRIFRMDPGFRIELAAEYDGESHTRGGLRRDRARHNWLDERGWTMRYFPDEALYRRPDRIVPVLRRAIATSRRADTDTPR